jgi:hypothetical protein
MAQMPWINHSWHVTLYVSPSGLTTSAIPYGERTFQIDFDFIRHELLVTTCDDESRIVPLDVMREAYSQEVSSAGFWPGGEMMPYPMFYSYAYPTPEGFKTAAVRPDAATWASSCCPTTTCVGPRRRSGSYCNSWKPPIRQQPKRAGGIWRP